MQSLLWLLSALSGLVFLVAFVPYIRAILKGETKPNRATWVIWGSLDWITAFAMYAEGTLNGMIVGAATGATIVVVLAFIYGESVWKRVDVLCLVGAFIGIVLWQLYDNALFGILVSQAVILVGSMPTFLNAAKNPEQEDRTAWTMYWTGALLAVLALPEWTLAHAAQPVNFFVVESVMLYLLYRPRVQKGAIETALPAPEDAKEQVLHAEAPVPWMFDKRIAELGSMLNSALPDRPSSEYRDDEEVAWFARDLVLDMREAGMSPKRAFDLLQSYRPHLIKDGEVMITRMF